MSGPRNYLTGTERALFELAKGACYFPGCPALTTVFVEGVPITNVHISHIHGAKRGSARFDESMTDKERASFANLLLLCKPHHDLVDRIDPDRFSPELLRQWKVDREGQDVGELNEIQGLTEQRLAEMLEAVILRVGLQRDVALEVTGGIILDAGNAITVPLDGWQRVLDRNRQSVAMGEKVVVATMRNTGGLAAAVEGYIYSISYYCRRYATRINAARSQRLPSDQPNATKTAGCWRFGQLVYRARYISDGACRTSWRGR